MKVTNNISLINIAGFRRINPILILEKLGNELFNRKTKKRQKMPATGALKSYADMLSFIVCTMGESSVFKETIRSLLGQRINEAFEIIIVDNSPDGISPEYDDERIRCIREPQIGLSRARNTGAAAAKGEYLFYIDDDAAAEPNAAAEMLTAFRRHPKAGVVGGQVRLELPVPVPEVFVPGREGIWSGYAVGYRKYREVREQYAFPYGACFGVRHSVLDAIGGFSTAYGRNGHDYAGGEETAVCFDVRRIGYRVGIMPSVVVHHYAAEDRYNKEHIRKTIRAGILTTHRLFEEGHAKDGWTRDYVLMRIDIARKEIEELLRRKKETDAFYIQCEQDAFLELLHKMEDGNLS